MKTEKSITKNALGKVLIDLAFKHLDSWANKEIESIIQKSKFPICLQTSDNSWLVGGYQISKHGEHCWPVTVDDKLVHAFYSKHAAIYYSVFTKCNYFKSADAILELDQKTAKLNDELHFYSKKLSKSKVNADHFKIQLWRTRHTDAKARYLLAKSELDIKLHSAKYAKLWTSILEK